MTLWTKISLFLLRVSMGWLFFYAGITKVLNPEWTAAGYLKGAKTFTGLYHWFASDANIGWVNFLNMWGLTLIGIALIFGVLLRLASYGGALIMILYYFPVLTFPYIKPHSYLVDEHIIYALLFVVLAAVGAGRIWGIDGWLEERLDPLLKRYPVLLKLLG